MGSHTSKPSSKSPPLYSSISPSEHKLPSEPPQIKATDAPQWLWTNGQCIEWLTAVFSVYAGYDPETAAEKAKEFKGFGPRIWQTGRAEWREWLGDGEGDGVHALLASLYRLPGTHPEGIRIMQFEPPKRDLGTGGVGGKNRK